MNDVRLSNWEIIDDTEAAPDGFHKVAEFNIEFGLERVRDASLWRRGNDYHVRSGPSHPVVLQGLEGHARAIAETKYKAHLLGLK